MKDTTQEVDVSQYTFVSGTELSTKELLLVAHPVGMNPGENPRSIFLTYHSDGQWSKLGGVKWLAEGISGNAQQDSLVMVHWAGSCLIYNKEEHTFSNIHTTEEDKDDPPCEVRFSKVVDGELYVGGTNHYLFQQKGAQWEEISTPAMKEDIILGSFENITGFNSQELYAFGWEGVIWTNKDGLWKQAEHITEEQLLDGAVLGDKVYIGGQAGIILEGRGDEWKLLESDLSNSDIVSVCSYQDAVYFSNTKNILRLKNGSLEVFQESTTTFKTFQLFVGPSGLWSVSDKTLALYNGEEWQFITSN